ncbi:Gfo/Idh/MocA family protein [Botrimarina hoheduenensis]|uniref:Putative oxidoreductase YcjS n=1 Tax=Botrimarina hoheduenensis TaxID=2528000 RepID=A0A5C5VRZ1_9BACT|nr:Gfo/Idh/MocA family oxidoreductase [Botrimarina hoheduenensis]TWT41406.1 putative oxidoreductase YcjS [Botrimarina hoheduenensis]
MRLGILGAGAIGEKHANAATSVGVEVTRIVDRDGDRALALASNYDAASSNDPKSLWDDANVDAVVIGVPNCFHKPLAIDAMRAGKDVLLEKPMALTAVECDELMSVAEDTGRLLQVGYVHRFTAVGSGAKRVVDAGELGNVYHAKAHLFIRRGIPGLGGWFTTKAMSGGGCLIDLGVHLLDLSLFLLGQPTAVAVSGKTYSKFGVKMRDYVYESMWAGPPNYDGVFDVDDSAHAMITFDTGATLDLQVTWAGNLPSGALPDSLMGLFGDRGGLTFELFGDHLRLAHEIGGRNADSKLALPEADQMALQMVDFSNAVAARQHGVGATPAEGRKVQALVDAIYASSEHNAPVTL